MKIRFLHVIILFCVLLAGFNTVAQTSKEESHIEVSLRMIGHQVLLYHSDSNSRVLPIEKFDSYYKIPLAGKFEFKPEQLVDIVDSVVLATNLANRYIVEIEDCTTKKIVYSYEFTQKEKSDIVPCGQRPQPISCYSILFTIIDADELILEGKQEPARANTVIILLMVFIGALIVLGVVYLSKKKRSKHKSNEDHIQLGAFAFDLKNLELIQEKTTIELTSKEADLLHLLYGSVNNTVERDDILKAVWGDEGDYIGRTLDVFISKLRKKLQTDPNIKIMNIRGVGYKLIINTP